MHEPIREGLEDFLAGTVSRERREAVEQHLAHCAECREETAGMKEHQGMLRHLRSPEEVCPAPGFYARVLARIEARKHPSIWTIFLEPAFGRRLMYASLALLVLLGTAVWQGGTAETMDGGNPMVVMAADLPEANGEDPGHDRAVVLTHLVGTGGEDQEIQTLPVSSD